MSDEPDPCKFCGTFGKRLQVIENANGWRVDCDGCDARTGYQPTRFQAVRAWNRVPSSK